MYVYMSACMYGYAAKADGVESILLLQAHLYSATRKNLVE